MLTIYTDRAEKPFKTLTREVRRGHHRWWLCAHECSACGQWWLVAQEASICESHVMRRMGADEVAVLRVGSEWPNDLDRLGALLELERAAGFATVSMPGFRFAAQSRHTPAASPTGGLCSQFSAVATALAGELVAPLTVDLAFDHIQVATSVYGWDYEPGGGHIDGYGIPGQTEPATFTLLAGIYLGDESAPGRGNLWVWPGSPPRATDSDWRPRTPMRCSSSVRSAMRLARTRPDVVVQVLASAASTCTTTAAGLVDADGRHERPLRP